MNKTNYENMANMLFPSVVYTPEYYEKKFPARNLPAGAEVTRLAPSPTGYLHIGHMFGAVVNFCVARSSSGVFYLRLEDTDTKREVEGAGLVAAQILNKFGVVYSEGYTNNGSQVGDYGPYVQSERKEIYQTYAKYLVGKGRAFPCFCEKGDGLEDVKKRREQQLSDINDFEQKDVCRNLTLAQVEKKLKDGKPFAIRLRSSGNIENKIVIDDGIKGAREIRENAKDIVLIKSDGMPPYAMAHAVDDHLMKTTLVVRGEEWYPSLSAHLELFDALGFEKVKYAHTPVICKIGDDGNKRKLSKRKDPEADMRYYLEKGYPTEAVLEYIMTLANTNFEEWRREHEGAELSQFVFSIAKTSNSNPMFDIHKLNDISKNIIAKLTADEVYEKAVAWSKEYDGEFNEFLQENKKYAIDVFSIDRYTKNPRKDIVMWSELKSYFNYMFFDLDFNLVEYDKRYDAKFINKIFKSYAESFDDNFTKDEWFLNCKNLAVSFSFCADNKLYKENPTLYNGNVGDYCSIIRQVVTGRVNSPDLFTICSILGSDKLKNISERFSSFVKN